MNVHAGTKLLQEASKYKVMGYPLVGALLGSCLGGPVGFVAGMKFGGLTALGCGFLGNFGLNLIFTSKQIVNIY